MIGFRRVIAALLIVCGPLIGNAAAQNAPITIVDVTGRTVKLPRPATRLLLAEGRQIVALSLLHPAPVSLLSGWLGDFRRNDSETYTLYRQKFPEIDAVPVLGLGSDGSFSVEQAIAIKPDVAVLGIGFAPSGHANDIARQLEASGIPVVFTDFFISPFDNTVPSMRILGRVIGRDKEASDYVEFYETHMKRIADAVSRSPIKRPSILVETHASPGDCCYAPGAGNIGPFISFAGGDSISRDKTTGATTHLGLEYVITKNPEIYVGTGGAHLKASGGLVMGPGFDADAIRKRLAAVIARPGFGELRAVRDGRVHGLFHNLLSTPLNLLATECLTRWINPDATADIDPAATMAEINSRFLAVPMTGHYWIDLK